MTRGQRRRQAMQAMQAMRRVQASAHAQTLSGSSEDALGFANLLARAEQRTMWLVTWIAGTVAGAIGWAGLEAGVAPWLGARRAAIVRIVAFVQRP